jgi:glycosyltransferase involved in cell wall biosynthesis
MPQLIVLLATFNGEKYLPAFLDSLGSQTRKADKIIAFDDASTDSTLKILNQYADQLPISVHSRKENGGHLAAFSDALNAAASIVQGDDLIALADQDDIWFPQKLEILENKIGNADLVFGDAEVIDESGNPISDSWRHTACIQENLTAESYIAGVNNVSGCVSLFRASLLTEILPIPQGVRIHDHWIALLALQRKGISSIPNNVIRYRIHSCNAVGLKPCVTFSQTLRESEEWLSMLLEKADILHFTAEQRNFTNRLLSLTQKRKTSFWHPCSFFWFYRNRKFLFPGCKRFGQFMPKVLFSTLGLPAAKFLFGKE